MKLHLPSYQCQINGKSVQIALFHVDNLAEFLNDHSYYPNRFLPDYVNLRLNKFLFFANSTSWKIFVDEMYDKSETIVCFHDVPAPDMFNLDNWFPCNSSIINYIIYPEHRDYFFLLETKKNAENKFKLCS